MIFFTTNLRILRKEANKTVIEIAEELDMGKSAFSAYENGNAFPKIETLVKMSSLFNVTLDDLVLKDLSQNTTNLTSLKTENNISKKEESTLITELQNRIADKEEMIRMLKEQLEFYKQNFKGY